MNFSSIIVTLCLAAILSTAGCKSAPSTSATGNNDSTTVAYSFVVLGCNRVDKADTNLIANPSTANLEQFNRTMTEIAAMSPKPSYVFFAGDMVFGYTNDSLSLAKQLLAWKALYEASPVKAAGITMVAIPGNHEMQNQSKIAYPAAENAWLSIMSPYIVGSNGPKAGGLDSLVTDQSALTYSFNFNDAHFVIMNTDPVGRDFRPASNWIASDVAAAKTAGAKHIFAIGHKPGYAYNYATGGVDGLNKFPANRDIFWSALENNKAEAMFAAHNHISKHFSPNNKTSMVIAGNGGSILETADIAATEKYFGYTVVTVYKSGKVVVRSMGRDIPAAGYMTSATVALYPTTMRDSAVISW